MKVTFEDRRLERIREKVEAGERLSYEDCVAMFRSSDLLALGYMANIVRERLHGDNIADPGQGPDGQGAYPGLCPRRPAVLALELGRRDGAP